MGSYFIMRMEALASPSVSHSCSIFCFALPTLLALGSFTQPASQRMESPMPVCVDSLPFLLPHPLGQFPGFTGWLLTASAVLCTLISCASGVPDHFGMQCHGHGHHLCFSYLHLEGTSSPQGLGRTFYLQWHFLILRTCPPVAGIASGSVLPAYPNNQLHQCNFQVPSDSRATPQPTFGVPDGCSLGPPNCSPFPFATRQPQQKLLI